MKFIKVSDNLSQRIMKYKKFKISPIGDAITLSFRTEKLEIRTLYYTTLFA